MASPVSPRAFRSFATNQLDIKHAFLQAEQRTEFITKFARSLGAVEAEETTSSAT